MTRGRGVRWRPTKAIQHRPLIVPAAGDPMTMRVQLRLVKLAGGDKNWGKAANFFSLIQ
jgi:hypothetical protein